MKLSKEEFDVLNAIKEYIDEYGYSPSVRDLCKLTGKNSPATIHYHLKHLKEKEYIDYIQGKNRTIRVVNNLAKEKKERFNLFRKWWK